MHLSDSIPLIGLTLLCLTPVDARAQAQGEVISWGLPAGDFGDYGQVTGSPSGADFIRVTAGTDHSLALKADGSIVAWGRDWWGQVSNTPTGTGFVAVAGGSMHSAAIDSNSSIVCWGSDTSGQISGTPTGTGFVQIDSGSHGLAALKSDGSIVCWGSDSYGQVSNAPTGTGFVHVACGAYHMTALKVDGSIVTWGQDAWNQVTNSPTGTGFTAVDAGGSFSIALRADGSIAAWGIEDQGTFDWGQVTNAPTGTGYIEVAAGTSFAYGIHSNGSIEGWGRDYNGMTSSPPSGTDHGQLSGGLHHAVVLKFPENSGSAFCFGDASGSPCPCLLFGNPGEGCLNTSGVGGALLTGSGSARASHDTFRLDVSGLPGSKPCLVLQGSSMLNLGFGNPIGGGLLCLAGQTFRSQVQTSTTQGTSTFSDFQGSAFGQTIYGIGLTSHYQLYYRDPVATCSGLDFNFSNAWQVTWLP